MPKKTDIQTILIIGAGPIVIGQGCEFDYSGTQACIALRKEGYKIILVNSNAATIMNDSDLADRTYIEPLTTEFIEKIIIKEKPDAILPTVGGQTALNLAIKLSKSGFLKEHHVEMIGAKVESIEKAEDRQLFAEAMHKIGLKLPYSAVVTNIEDALHQLKTIGLPAIIRPSFTLGGTGGGIAYNVEEFEKIISDGLNASPIHSVQIDRSVLGWKEYELEVMRDKNGNFSIICSIENLDPMGVHTGDSITIAPAMTLTDKEYQEMRNAAKIIIEEIGIETGGANVQFAVNPQTGEQLVVEMNPRVSRSSALASKATGYPIAKIAALVAVGLTLDEIMNDCTEGIPAAFEPVIDYIVVKTPRFNFDKFPNQKPHELTTSMQAIGESMAIGRSFTEALQKAICSLEENIDGLYTKENKNLSAIELLKKQKKLLSNISRNIPDKLLQTCDAMRNGSTYQEICAITKYDPWFISQISENIIDNEKKIIANGLISKEEMFEYKKQGFSDARLAFLMNRHLSSNNNHNAKSLSSSDALLDNHNGDPLCGIVNNSGSHALVNSSEDDNINSKAGIIKPITRHDIYNLRQKLNINPVFKRVDTCAGEFDVRTNYLYSTYDGDIKQEIFVCESNPTNRKKVIIIGGGCNRIGQGIEFDYSCVHAATAVKELDLEAIMINCNPETVSTDYQISDRLYFEPLDIEHVLNIINAEKKNGEILGVIVQFGGQTSLKLVNDLKFYNIPILGTNPDSLDIAEDRKRFKNLLDGLNLQQPKSMICEKPDELKAISSEMRYPILVRPSHVLGGRSMMIIYQEDQLDYYLKENPYVFENGNLLIDEFLDQATEIDVDVISDGNEIRIAGIMEHIEEAGVHSGDSTCIVPPPYLNDNIIDQIKTIALKLTKALNVIGLINIQMAIKNNEIYIIEANPRASRTIPFISKYSGISFAKIATYIMCGKKLTDYQELFDKKTIKHYAVKMPVFPFLKFKNADINLGPEMKSTGESMGIDKNFEAAFAKAFIGTGQPLPTFGKALISVRDGDKNETLINIAKNLISNEFILYGTDGTAEFLLKNNIPCNVVNKVTESRPNIMDLIINNDVVLYINTSDNFQAIREGLEIRRQTMMKRIPCIRTLSHANSLVQAISYYKKYNIDVHALQDYSIKKDDNVDLGVLSSNYSQMENRIDMM